MIHKVIGVCGFKNAGKTTLVEKLVRHMTSLGYRVSTIKHAHHDFDIDQEGRDSFRHRKAGASEVAVVSQKRLAILYEFGDQAEPPLSDVLARLKPCDLVIIEGYKRDFHDKIEVRNLALSHPVLAGDDPTIIAIAASGPIQNAPVPTFGRDDVAELANFIIQHMNLQPIR
jgi:molybdopterin-guanine dinucleotide biosynthesis protein B